MTIRELRKSVGDVFVKRLANLAAELECALAEDGYRYV